MDLVTKKKQFKHIISIHGMGAYRTGHFFCSIRPKLTVEGPYPRVLNLKPMTMSRYLVFDILREPDGDCYENVPECAVQAQRGLDQANEEYRQQDAIANLKKSKMQWKRRK